VIAPTLIILAGGHSKRMGRPKHELPVGGATLLEWQVARLGRFFSDLIVVGAAAPVGARSVSDRREDGGPLAGIEAGLDAMRMSPAFVLACDMPRATPSLGWLLVRLCEGHDAAVPRVSGRAQPTCAAYARSAAPKLAAYLDAGERRATEALDRLDLVFVDEAELTGAGVALTELDDIDTPADYDAFLASLRA
jgi:molybdopterin-guanine dinucleotide biosynthesis protein A